MASLKNFVTDPGLGFSLLLVLVVLAISFGLRIKLAGEIIWSTLRGVIQLTLVGFILLWLFSLEDPWAIYLTLGLMVLMAGWITQQRGKAIPHRYWIVTLSLLVSTGLTLWFLVMGRAVEPTAKFLIPLGGMIIGNSMKASSLVFNRLQAEMKLRRSEILLYLSLGASPFQASHQIIQEAVKASLIPTLDTLKALGIIFFPGIMVGLILAGSSPLVAVRYQIIVVLMLMASTALTSLMVSLASFRQCFTKSMQLKESISF